MSGGEAAQQMEAVRSEVEQVCLWLAKPSPETIDRCTGVLARATSELSRDVERFSLAAGDPTALAEAWKLRRAVRRAGQLMEHAAEYHLRWNRELASKMDGYRPGGEPAPLVHPSRISLKG